MNLYYAMGGGLGHLTRAAAFLQTLGIENDSVILTASPFAKDRRIVGNIRTISVDKSFAKDVRQFQNHLKNLFSELRPERLFIDSFPLGIIGEFADFEFNKTIEINYLARHLSWKNYSSLFAENFPQFEKIYLLEPLETEHQKLVKKCSKQLIEFELTYLSPNLSQKDFQTVQNIIQHQRPFWLIVHSGNEVEIEELAAFADEMREIEKSKAQLILISPIKVSLNLSNLFQFDLYPASILFESAQKIFSAGGFNIMKQTEGFRAKHYFIPFERRYDNQFWRAKMNRPHS